MKQRMGSTLVELVLSMSAGSTVMLLAISLVHQTMTSTDKSRHLADSNRTFDQLAHSVRRDVRMAAEVDVTSSDSCLIKNPDGSSVSYTCLNHSVVRQLRGTTLVNENERFILGDKSEFQFVDEHEGKRGDLSVAQIEIEE